MPCLLLKGHLRDDETLRSYHLCSGHRASFLDGIGIITDKPVACRAGSYSFHLCSRRSSTAPPAFAARL